MVSGFSQERFREFHGVPGDLSGVSRGFQRVSRSTGTS